MSTVDRKRKSSPGRHARVSILAAPGSAISVEESLVDVTRPAAPGAASAGEFVSQPAYFSDLNLDQVLAALVEGRERYRLEPYFYSRLRDEQEVRYRQEVMQELEEPDVRGAVEQFGTGMGELRRCLDLAAKLRNPQQRHRWFLAGIETYCGVVARLSQFTAEYEFRSAGLSALAEHLSGYAESPEYLELTGETADVVATLSDLTYSLRIKGARVTVDSYRDEPHLAEEVGATFAKFRQDDAENYVVGFHTRVEANQVEDQILRLVAKLYPEEFAELERYYARHVHSIDQTLERFDREAQFLLAYQDYIAPLRAHGLEFSYPSVSSTAKLTRAHDTFDIALASKLAGEGGTVVTNDLELDGRERVLVITGPNQGGKTTYARTFGQLHHLAALGLPVPGTETQLFLGDQLFTHFPRTEDLDSLQSRFEEELQRMREILGEATADSVLVMNESFTSTTLNDAVEVGTLVLSEILERGMLCLCVTFVDELSALSDRVVSMMSTVSTEDPTVRTFKVTRKPADGLAYAMALADRYGLGYERLSRRLAGPEHDDHAHGGAR